jgi:plasmid maintenance system killer protein
MIKSFKSKETEKIFNRQWQIVFSWINDNAYNVEIVDYH